MNLLHIIILAVTAGVAEALPIDASGHSLLAAKLLGWRAASISVAIQLGTVLAILVYLWRDVRQIGLGLGNLLRGRLEPGFWLLLKAFLAAAPWLVADLLRVLPGKPAEPSQLLLTGIITLLVAVLMGVADRLCMTVNRVEHLTPPAALLLGLAQLAGLLTGVGRVAAAFIMARLLGLERPTAYRFILLASVPVLLLTAIQRLLTYSQQGVTPLPADLLACGVTFLLVLSAIALAMDWVRRSGLLVFVLYRLLFGCLLLAVALL